MELFLAFLQDGLLHKSLAFFWIFFKDICHSLCDLVESLLAIDMCICLVTNGGGESKPMPI